MGLVNIFAGALCPRIIILKISFLNVKKLTEIGKRMKKTEAIPIYHTHLRGIRCLFMIA